jgi:hypothetical protein
MVTKIDELENKIQLLIKELIEIAEATGLNSQDTICCSQKLDQYIMIYQRLLPFAGNADTDPVKKFVKEH